MRNSYGRIYARAVVVVVNRRGRKTDFGVGRRRSRNAGNAQSGSGAVGEVVLYLSGILLSIEVVPVAYVRIIREEVHALVFRGHGSTFIELSLRVRSNGSVRLRDEKGNLIRTVGIGEPGVGVLVEIIQRCGGKIECCAVGAPIGRDSGAVALDHELILVVHIYFNVIRIACIIAVRAVVIVIIRNFVYAYLVCGYLPALGKHLVYNVYSARILDRNARITVRSFSGRGYGDRIAVLHAVRNVGLNDFRHCFVGAFNRCAHDLHIRACEYEADKQRQGRGKSDYLACYL